MADRGLGQAECHGLVTEWKVLTNEVSKVESRKYLEEGQQGSGGGMHLYPPMVAGARSSSLLEMGPQEAISLLGLGAAWWVWGSGKNARTGNQINHTRGQGAQPGDR